MYLLNLYIFTTAETCFCVPREGIEKSRIALVWGQPRRWLALGVRYQETLFLLPSWCHCSP